MGDKAKKVPEVYVIDPLPEDMPEARKKLLAVVIPTYNESMNISSLVESLISALEPRIPGKYEIIVVDDNSPDGTWKIAGELGEKYPQVRSLRRKYEKGLASAVIRGWQMSDSEFLGVIDGDGQHPPEKVTDLLELLTDFPDTDLAVASRHVDGGGVSDWSVARRIISRGAQVMGLIIAPGVVGRVSDPMSGYFVVRRSAIAGKRLTPIGYKISLEVIAKGDIREVKESGYIFKEREKGESKIGFRIYFEYIFQLLNFRMQSLKKKTGLKLSREMISRYMRFMVVGGSGVFVDSAVLFLLSDPVMLGWGLTRSKIIAAELALINNFIWNDIWTFGDISREQKGWKKRVIRFLKFNLICLIGLVINVVILNVLFNYAGMNRYIANLIAIFIASVWNFYINLKLSWRTSRV